MIRQATTVDAFLPPEHPNLYVRPGETSETIAETVCALVQGCAEELRLLDAAEWNLMPPDIRAAADAVLEVARKL